ncbi:MAG: polysaccharide deacetylase, partial [Methylocystis sp.]
MQSLSPLSRCAQICGLSSQEMILGASPRPEHELLAARYSRSSTVGKATMRSAMVAAIRAALRASQKRSAAELLVALRMMLGARRGRSGAPRRRSRRCFYESRRPVVVFS